MNTHIWKVFSILVYCNYAFWYCVDLMKYTFTTCTLEMKDIHEYKVCTTQTLHVCTLEVKEILIALSDMLVLRGGYTRPTFTPWTTLTLHVCDHGRTMYVLYGRSWALCDMLRDVVALRSATARFTWKGSGLARLGKKQWAKESYNIGETGYPLEARVDPLFKNVTPTNRG